MPRSYSPPSPDLNPQLLSSKGHCGEVKGNYLNGAISAPGDLYSLSKVEFPVCHFREGQNKPTRILVRAYIALQWAWNLWPRGRSFWGHEQDEGLKIEEMLSAPPHQKSLKSSKIESHFIFYPYVSN